MSVFHFKQFDVVNDRSAMKVNTDGVLLGALASISGGRILDIGTGTGTIALMAAQRCQDAVVEAIDIDEASASEAAANFAASRWADRLTALNMSLNQYEEQLDERRFDAILSNPPYFDNSLTNPDERKTDARHTASLSYREILAFAADRLAPDGLVALVLPSEEEARLCREARSRGLFLSHIVRIRTTPKKQPKRIVAEFTRNRIEIPSDTVLTIQEDGQYTAEYLTLMSDFYLFA